MYVHKYCKMFGQRERWQLHMSVQELWTQSHGGVCTTLHTSPINNIMYCIEVWTRHLSITLCTALNTPPINNIIITIHKHHHHPILASPPYIMSEAMCFQSWKTYTAQANEDGESMTWVTRSLCLQTKVEGATYYHRQSWQNPATVNEKVQL